MERDYDSALAEADEAGGNGDEGRFIIKYLDVKGDPYPIYYKASCKRDRNACVKMANALLKSDESLAKGALSYPVPLTIQAGKCKKKGKLKKSSRYLRLTPGVLQVWRSKPNPRYQNEYPLQAYSLETLSISVVEKHELVVNAWDHKVTFIFPSMQERSTWISRIMATKQNTKNSKGSKTVSASAMAPVSTTKEDELRLDQSRAHIAKRGSIKVSVGVASPVRPSSSYALPVKAASTDSIGNSDSPHSGGGDKRGGDDVWQDSEVALRPHPRGGVIPPEDANVYKVEFCIT